MAFLWHSFGALPDRMLDAKRVMSVRRLSQRLNKDYIGTDPLADSRAPTASKLNYLTLKQFPCVHNGPSMMQPRAEQTRISLPSSSKRISAV
jgi:hypothetical protein